VFDCKIMCWVDLGQLPDARPTTFSFPFLNRARGENKMRKLMGQEKETGDHMSVTNTAKTNLIWGKKIFFCHLKYIWMKRNKGKI